MRRNLTLQLGDGSRLPSPKPAATVIDLFGRAGLLVERIETVDGSDWPKASACAKFSSRNSRMPGQAELIEHSSQFASLAKVESSPADQPHFDGGQIPWIQK
jgi:hypothetical protein